MKLLRNEWVCLAARLFLGGVFVYAAIPKIIDPAGFARQINNYHLLPGFLVNIVALIMPWLEFVAGTALILGLRVPGAAAVIAGLLVIFLVAVSATLARGINIDCGCFTTSPKGRKLGASVLIGDIGLLILGLIVFINGAGRWAWDRPYPRMSTPMTVRTISHDS